MLLAVSRKRTSLPAGVREERAVEGSVQGKPPAGLDGDCLIAPDGRTYRLTDARLSPRRAFELVMAGALVAFVAHR